MNKLVAVGAAAVLSLSLAPAAQGATDDESPDINDTATLVGGKVIDNGSGAKVRLRLTCPKGDRYSAFMALVLASDASASGTKTGRCTGSPQKVTIRLAKGEGPRLKPGCDAEYGVTITGTDWLIAFDRGGADGGPDGPGPQLCLR